jgi:hypothetical protein
MATSDTRNFARLPCLRLPCPRHATRHCAHRKIFLSLVSVHVLHNTTRLIYTECMIERLTALVNSFFKLCSLCVFRLPLPSWQPAWPRLQDSDGEYSIWDMLSSSRYLNKSRRPPFVPSKFHLLILLWPYAFYTPLRLMYILALQLLDQ